MSSQKPRPPERDFDTVVAHDLRPAGNGKDCFYCAQPLGTKHKEDCVIRRGAGQYLVYIRCNATGEIRAYRYDMTWQNEDGQDVWMWTEGNLACDCNRHMMFDRAIGIDEWQETECGDTRYTCLYAQLPDGTCHNLDGEPDATLAQTTH